MTNADAAQPFVEFELDKKRKFTFDFNAMCACEKLTGKNLFKHGHEWESPDANLMRGIVYGGFLTDDPLLTPGKAGQLIEEYPHIMSICYEHACKRVIELGKKKQMHLAAAANQ